MVKRTMLLALLLVAACDDDAPPITPPIDAPTENCGELAAQFTAAALELDTSCVMEGPILGDEQCAMIGGPIGSVCSDCSKMLTSHAVNRAAYLSSEVQSLEERWRAACRGSGPPQYCDRVPQNTYCGDTGCVLEVFNCP